MHQIELHGHINTTSQINNKHFMAITKNMLAGTLRQELESFVQRSLTASQAFAATSVYGLEQGSQTHLSMWATVEDNSQSAGRTTKCNCFTQHCSHCS